jgi:thiol-disulfide isomerase/thioredoxin
MRILILFALFNLLLTPVRAYENNFVIKGEVTGSKTFQYAYIFDDEMQLVSQLNIKEGKFAFSGSTHTKLRFGELPIVYLLLSNNDGAKDKIRSDNLLGNRSHDNCTIMIEDSIYVSYNSDRKKFVIKGGKLNQDQSLFLNAYSNFRNKKDSLLQAIDRKDIAEKAKGELKSIESKKLFTTTMYGLIDIVRVHPNSEVALNNFSPIIYDQGITGSEVMTAFRFFTDSLRQSRYGLYVLKDITDKINAEAEMNSPSYTVGMKFPNFIATSESGTMVKSESTYGKFTLIDFWATWCAPCRKETPNLIAAYDTYHPRGFNVLSVSIDDQKDHKKWQEVLKEDRMSRFLNLFNGSDISGIARKLKIASIPANYLVDQEGNIIAINLRGDLLDAKLKQLFLHK